MDKGQHEREPDRQRLKLVLPKTFFHAAFLTPYDPSPEAFRLGNRYHFIANLVIEVTSCLPEDNVMAATTQRAWNEFSAEVRGREFALGGKQLLALFENMVVVVPTESWGNLSDAESAIALADRLYSTSSLDPLIIAHPEGVQNFRDAAAHYYGKPANTMNPLDIPFKILDPVEAKAHLEAVFAEEAKAVLRKTMPPFNYF